MAELYPAPKFKWFKDDGTVASGYKVFTYEPGSSTKKATYTSIAATSENANPVVLDSRGEASIYFDGSYKIVVATPTDTDPPVGTVTTIDNYRSGTSTSAGGGGSLIDNGGFETLLAGSATLPDGWNVVQTGTVAVDNSTQSEGEYSLKFTSTGSGGGTATSSSFVAVDVNRKYVLRLTMKTGATVNAANKAQIIWYTSTQTVISTSTYLNDTTARTSFTALEYRVTPVATAAYFKVVLTGVDTSGASGTETTWFDNVSVVEADAFAALSDTSTIVLTTHASNVLTLDSSALTANRSLTYPDIAGEIGVAITRPNLLYNGGFRIAQRGTTFDATTTPANNDDTYLLDRWVLLSDGNDAFDITQGAPSGNNPYAWRFDTETIDKKGGMLQVLPASDSYGLRGKTVSLSFKGLATSKAAGRIENVKAVVLSWDGTADTVTSDVVSAWGADGTTPTWAANWTAENTPVNIVSSITTSGNAGQVKIENISVDTSGMNNLAVFIWIDDPSGTAGDFLYIYEAKLEVGANATAYVDRRYAEDLSECEAFFQKYQPATSNGRIANGSAVSTSAARFVLPFKRSMFKAPTVTYSAAATWLIGYVGGTSLGTAISSTLSPESFVLAISVTGTGTPLTSGQAVFLERDGTDTSYIWLDSEL